MRGLVGGFAGKRAYVTGGSSGIGKAIAIALARRGAHVYVSARGKDRLRIAEAEIRGAAATPSQIIGSLPLDVSRRPDVEAAAREVLDALGGIDLVVNNAGIAHVGLLDDTHADDFERTMSVNYFGTVYTTLAFLPALRAQRSGVVACVSSTLGQMGLFGYSAYAASKFAITGFCDCLRQDLLKYGVQVSVLFPADTDTPQLHEENKTKPAETRALSETASLTSPEVVADAFLAGVAAGRFHIVPGLSNKAILWLNQKMPWLPRAVIDSSLRKHWRQLPAAEAAGKDAAGGASQAGEKRAS